MLPVRDRTQDGKDLSLLDQLVDLRFIAVTFINRGKQQITGNHWKYFNRREARSWVVQLHTATRGTLDLKFAFGAAIVTATVCILQPFSKHYIVSEMDIHFESRDITLVGYIYNISSGDRKYWCHVPKVFWQCGLLEEARLTERCMWHPHACLWVVTWCRKRFWVDHATLFSQQEDLNPYIQHLAAY